MILKWEIPDVVFLKHVALPHDAERLNFILVKRPYLSHLVHGCSEYYRDIGVSYKLDCLYNVLMRLPLCNLLELEFFKQGFDLEVAVVARVVTKGVTVVSSPARLSLIYSEHSPRVALSVVSNSIDWL